MAHRNSPPSKLAPSISRSARGALLAAIVLAPTACQSGKVPEPERKAAATASAKPAGGAAGAGAAASENKAAKPRPPIREPEFRKVAAKPVAKLPPTPGDPANGKFEMDDALKGLSGSGKQLFADMETSLGKLECELWPDKAPLTVANFIGLATGQRTWKDPSGSWVNRPAYDGTTFHRVIKGFMIQGGDSKGNGSGEPGYTFNDEYWDGATHDRAGLLCMANRGPNTNGAQFFIMDAAAAHLDRDHSYTIFGDCGPLETVHAIANVPVMGEAPVKPVIIKTVKIAREKSGDAGAAASGDAGAKKAAAPVEKKAAPAQ
jgi:peptidyl-prolyl cis-trans isomerase A (cyclophilin A)